MIVELFDDLDRDNPFFELCRAVKLFVSQVDEAGHLLEEHGGKKDWTQHELPPFTGYNLIRAASDYRKSHTQYRDRLRFEFGRFAEPDGELEHLLAILEFTSFPDSFETAQDVFDAERTIENDLKPAYPIWRKLSVRLDGLIQGFFRGDHVRGKVVAVVVPKTHPSAGDNVEINGGGHRVGIALWRALRKLADAREHDQRLSLNELREAGGEDVHGLLREFDKLGEGYPLIDFPNGVKGRGYALN